MRHQNGWLTLTFLSVFAIVLSLSGQANAETWSYSARYSHNGVTLSEVVEFESPDAITTGQYEGTQTAAALMAAFDAAYTKARPKTTVTVSRQGKRAEIKSEWTEAEIDARYPRAEWLQLLLDKDITITHFGDYAMSLSKRHTLALLKDNPKLWQWRLLGIPPTKDWHTYKAAYLNKGVDFHAQSRKVAASVEAVKEQVERAKELIPAVPAPPHIPAMPIPAVPAPPHIPAMPNLWQEVDEIEQLVEEFKAAIEEVSKARDDIGDEIPQLVEEFKAAIGEVSKARDDIGDEIEQLVEEFKAAIGEVSKARGDIGEGINGQLKHTKAQVAHAKQQLKRAEAQVERARQQLRRAQEALERERKRTSPPAHKREPKQDSKEGTL